MSTYDSTVKAVLHSSYDILLYEILFCQVKHLPKITLKNPGRLKSNEDPTLCQFFYFICGVILDKLSELWKIICVT